MGRAAMMYAVPMAVRAPLMGSRAPSHAEARKCSGVSVHRQ